MFDDLFTNENMDTYQTLLGGTSRLVSGIQEYNMANVDYDLLNLKAGVKENQALQIELQATQIANKLREQFTEVAGEYTHTAARRGVKVGEGSMQDNIEQSAKALGKDVSQLDANAKRQSKVLRSEASATRDYAGKMKSIDDSTKMFNLIDSVVGSFQTFSTLGTKTIGEAQKEAYKNAHPLLRGKTATQYKDERGTVLIS